MRVVLPTICVSQTVYAKPVLMISTTGTGVLVVPIRLSVILHAHHIARELVSCYTLLRKIMTTTELNVKIPIMAHTWSSNALTMKAGVVQLVTLTGSLETTISPAAPMTTLNWILARLYTTEERKSVSPSALSRVLRRLLRRPRQLILRRLPPFSRPLPQQSTPPPSHHNPRQPPRPPQILRKALPLPRPL